MKILNLEEIHLKLFVLVFRSFFLLHFYSVEWFVWRHWLNVFPPQATAFRSRFFSNYFPDCCVFYFISLLLLDDSGMARALSRRPIIADAYCCGISGGKIDIGTGCSPSTVGYARTNRPTKNECYNKQFLSIKSGCYNEHRCYNERFFYAFFYGKRDYSFH